MFVGSCSARVNSPSVPDSLNLPRTVWINLTARSETPLPSVFPPSFSDSEKKSVATATANVVGSISMTPFACAMQRYTKALGATESPPNGCKMSRLTCAASRHWPGLCRHLGAYWSRNCNRIFVSCYMMRDTAYLYDALGRRLYLTPQEG